MVQEENQEKKNIFTRGRDFLLNSKGRNISNILPQPISSIIGAWKSIVDFSKKDKIRETFGKATNAWLNVLKKFTEVDKNIKEQNERVENEQEVKQTSQNNWFEDSFNQKVENEFSNNTWFQQQYIDIFSLEEDIETLEKRKEEMKSTPQNTPEYEAEFVNINKFLRSKKNELDLKLSAFNTELENISQKVEEENKQRIVENPYRYFFTKEENAEQFINNVIAPFEFDETGNKLKDSMEWADALRAGKQALGSFTSKMNRWVIENMVKNWLINTSDEFLMTDERESFSKDVMSTMETVVLNNYDKIFKNGEIDENQYRAVLLSDENFQWLEKRFSNMYNKYKQQNREYLVKEEFTNLKDNAGNIIQDITSINPIKSAKAKVDLLSSLWNFTSYTINAYKWDKLSWAWEFFAEQWIWGPTKSVKEDIVNQFIPWSWWFRHELERDLLDTDNFAETAVNALWLIGWRRVMSKATAWRAAVTDITKYPRILKASEKAPLLRHFTKVIDVSKWALREIKGSLLLDMWIDTITGEPQPVMNAAINSVIWWLTHLPWAGWAIKIADRIFFQKPASRVKLLEDIGIKATKEQVKDIESVRNLVGEKINLLVTNEDQLKSFMVSNISKWLEDINTENPIGYYGSMVDVFKEIWWESPLGNRLTTLENIVTKMREWGDVKQLSSQAKEELLAVANNLSANGYKKLLNIKIKEGGIEALTTNITSIFKDMWLSDEASMLATAKTISTIDNPSDIIWFLKSSFPEDAAKLEGNLWKFSQLHTYAKKTQELLGNPIENIWLLDNISKVSKKNMDDAGRLYEAVLSSKKANMWGWIRPIDEAWLETYTVAWQQKLRNKTWWLYNSITDADKLSKEWFGKSFLNSVSDFISESWDGLRNPIKDLYIKSVSKIIQDTGIETFQWLVWKMDITKMSNEDVAKYVYENAARNILFSEDAISANTIDNLKDIWLQNMAINISNMKWPVDDILDFAISENQWFISGVSVNELKSFANVDNEARRTIDRIDDIIDSIDEGQYIKMLRTGLVIWWKKLVQSVYEVANKIRRSIADGTIPDIDPAYFTTQWKLLLDSVFEWEKYKNVYIKAYNKQKSKINNILETLSVFFNNNVISNSLKVWWRNMSFAEILRRIPLRFSEGVDVVSREAAAFYPWLVLTKYLAQHEWWEVFLRQYSKMLNSVTSWKSQDIWQEFAQKLWTESFWDAIVKLYNDVGNYLRTEVWLWEDIISDWIHPIIYNPLEYAGSVMNIGKYEDILEEVTRTIVKRNRHTLYNLANSDEVLDSVDNVLRNIPKNQQANWRFVPYDIKNSYNALLEEWFLKALDDWEITMSLSPTWFDEYLYKIWWYFTTMNNIGLANSKNNTYLSTIYKYLGEMTDEQSGKIIQMISDITSINPKTGKYFDVDKKVNVLKKYIKDIAPDKIDDTSTVLDGFSSYIKWQEENTISSSLIDDMYNQITKSKTDVKKKISKKSNVEGKSIEQDIEEVDTRVSFVEFANKLEQENLLRMMNDTSTREALAKWDANDVVKIMSQAWLSNDDMVMLLKGMWYSDSSVSKLLSEGKLTASQSKSIKDDIPKVVMRMVADGSMSMLDGMRKNKTFREYVNNILLGNIWVVKNNQWEKWFKIDKFGNVISETDKVFEWFTKYFTSLNTKAFLDEETNQLVRDYLNARKSKYTDFSFRYGKLTGVKSVSSEMYSSMVRSAIADYMKNKSLSSKTLSDMLSDVYKWVENNKKIKDVLNERNFSDDEAWLASMLWDYFSDVKNKRGGLFGDLTYFQDAVWWQIDSNTTFNILNRITGWWTMMTNDMINTLSKKIPEWKSWFANMFTSTKRNILYGSIFDKSIVWWASRSAARLIMLAWFGPQQLGKFVQQSINQEFLGESMIKQMSYDWNKLKKIEDFVDLQYDSATAGSINLRTLFNYDGKITWNFSLQPLKRKVAERSNVMVWADNITQKTAMKAAIVDSLYNVYDGFGVKWVEKFLDKVWEMSTFMDRYGLTKSDMYKKEQIMAKVWNGKVPSTEDMKIINDMHNFYLKDYNKFSKDARTSLHIFYVQDSVAELWFTPITDTARWLFPLRRWAIGKSSEYASRFMKEVNKKWVGNALVDIMKWNSQVVNSAISELSQTYKLWRALEKLTWGEIDRETSMLYLSVVTSAMYMSFVTPILESIKEWQHVWRITKDIEWVNSAAAGITWWLVTFIREMKATNFLYESSVVSNLIKSWNTASAIEWDENKEWKWVGTFFRNMFFGTMINSLNQNYSGFRSMSDTDWNLSTNIVEFLLNARWPAKRDQLRQMNEWYITASMSEWFGSALWQHFLYGILWQGRIQRWASPDLGVIFNSVYNFQNEKSLGLLTDKYAFSRDKERMNEIMNEFSYFGLKQSVLNLISNTSPENKKLRAMVIDMQKRYGNDLEHAPIDEVKFIWYLLSNTNHPMLDVIKTSLRWGSGIWADMESFIQETEIWREDFDNLTEQFAVMFNNIEWWWIPTDTEIRKMIMAQSSVWTNYILSDYIAAMQIAIRQHLSKEMWLWDKRDPEKKQVMFSANMSESERKQYIEYADTANIYQEEIIKSIWPIVWGNDFVWQQLMMQYIQNSPESPMSSFTDREEAMMRHAWFRDGIQKDWYVSQEALNPYYIMRNQIAKRAKAISSDKPDVAEAIAKELFNSLQKEVDTVLSAIDDPVAQQQWLSALMRAYSDIISEFNTLVPEELQTLLDRQEIKDAVQDTLNVLTDAVPADIETAYEYATWTNLNPWWKVRKINLSVRQQKPKEMALARNKFVDFALKLWNTGKFDITPIKYKVIPSPNKNSLVSIQQVNVRIPEAPKSQWARPVRWSSTRTADLRVADTRGKTWVKFSWRFRPKSIKFTTESS